MKLLTSGIFYARTAMIFSPATTVVVDLPALSALSSEERIQGRWGQVTQQSRRVEDVDDGPI